MEIYSAGATLQGSFTGATGNIHLAGIEVARYSTALTGNEENFYYDDECVGDVTDGNISVFVSSLSPSTTYYYRAFVAEYNASTGEYEYRYGDVYSFTTTAESSSVAASGWMELPAATTGSDYFSGSFSANNQRNYSYLYQKSRYTSLWVAYPLTASHISGTASSTNWNYNPNIAQDLQINVKSNSYGKNYGNSTYSRGHQIPAADRKCNGTMRGQTFYLTNQTPQIQQNFNSPMWSNLEDAVRDLTSDTDTVYVVTGAAFRKVGGSETIKELHSSTVTPSTIYIPNYYWKVLLKVTWTGSGSNRRVTAAKAVGVWMDHKTYSDQTAWQQNTYTVKQIEQWTGFDFFANLPDDVEVTAENNSNWSIFANF